MNEGQPKPSISQNATAAPTAPADAADRCLQCHAQAPGARYRFWVARRQRLTPHIVHEEKAFICDRCAGARLRFAPRVVLLLWVPALALGTLLVSRPFVGDLRRLFTAGIWMRPGQFGPAFRLVLLLGLLFLLVALIRLARRQLLAVRYRLFHRLPYSGSVTRLAIQLRKKELLRDLHLSESSALFLTEEDRAIRARHY